MYVRYLKAVLRCIAVICCWIIDIIQGATASTMSEKFYLPQITKDVLKIDCRRGTRKLVVCYCVNPRWEVSLGCRLSCRSSEDLEWVLSAFHPVCNMTCLGHWSSNWVSFLWDAVLERVPYIRVWSNLTSSVYKWCTAPLSDCRILYVNYILSLTVQVISRYFWDVMDVIWLMLFRTTHVKTDADVWPLESRTL